MLSTLAFAVLSSSLFFSGSSDGGGCIIEPSTEISVDQNPIVNYCVPVNNGSSDTSSDYPDGGFQVTITHIPEIVSPYVPENTTNHFEIAINE